MEAWEFRTLDLNITLLLLLLLVVLTDFTANPYEFSFKQTIELRIETTCK